MMNWAALYRFFSWASVIFGGAAPLWDLIVKIKSVFVKQREHYFIFSMKRYLLEDIPQYQNDNYKKECIIKIFLYHKFKVFLEFGENLFRDQKIPDDIEQKVSMLIDKYNRIARKEGVPKIFIDKFNVIHRGLVRGVNFGVSNAIRNKNLSDKEKINKILDALLIGFEATRVDIRQSLKEINGEFEKALKDFEPSAHPLYAKLQM